MIKPSDPRQLAVDLLPRSTCSVKVAAVLVDKWGHIFAWGWNNSGPIGYGQCAERHAIIRANKKRLRGSKIYVAGTRSRNLKPVPSKPCEYCQKLLDHYGVKAVYRDSDGSWK
jgi:cytidine deaminase